jgi:hypothetical protein
MKAVSKSWVFFVGAFLLSRNASWKRHFALALTCSYSLYLAIFNKDNKMTNYFNMFANLLYVVIVVGIHLQIVDDSNFLRTCK